MTTVLTISFYILQACVNFVQGHTNHTYHDHSRFTASSPWLPVGSVPSFIAEFGLPWLGAAQRQAMLTWCETFARRMIWTQVEQNKERTWTKFWKTNKTLEKWTLVLFGNCFLCEFRAGGMEGHKIQSLSQAGVIHTDHVEQAMLKVDRSNYAPRNAYTDAPQPLGHQARLWNWPSDHVHHWCVLERVARDSEVVPSRGCGVVSRASIAW